MEAHERTDVALALSCIYAESPSDDGGEVDVSYLRCTVNKVVKSGVKRAVP